MENNLGKVHSIETFGTVDGPGIRFVVFLQGCPLKCLYCHNRDTWEVNDGNETNVDDLVAEIKRYIPYIESSNGGVAVSGGEPVLEAKFVTCLFKKVQEEDNKHHAWDFYTTTTEIEEEIECFASLIELDLSSKERYIPRYNENIDSNKFLQTLAFKGLQKRLNGKEVSVYKQRLTYELNVIEGMGDRKSVV